MAWEPCERLLLRLKGTDSEESEAQKPLSAAALLREAGPALASGLGQEADARLLGGGLRPGEVYEVFGAAAVGKTQLGLSVAAHAAAAGKSARFLSCKDAPLQLANRLAELLPSEEALAKVRMGLVLDFPELARALSQAEEEAPDLLVLDGVTNLLAPFVRAGFGQRWRLAWTWRQLRALRQTRVLLLSNIVGGEAAGAQLGAAWAGAAATLLELREFQPKQATPGRCLQLRLKRSAHGTTGASMLFLLTDRGLCPYEEPCGAEMEPEAVPLPWT